MQRLWLETVDGEQLGAQNKICATEIVIGQLGTNTDRRAGLQANTEASGEISAIVRKAYGIIAGSDLRRIT